MDTIEEVAQALGLDNPWEFGCEQIARNMANRPLVGSKFAYESPHRGTGRTTRMLMSALVGLNGQRRTVSVSGGTRTLSNHLAEMLREWVERLGLEGQVEVSTDNRAARVVLVDHWALNPPHPIHTDVSEQFERFFALLPPSATPTRVTPADGGPDVENQPRPELQVQ
jgi:hypothetical protein